MSDPTTTHLYRGPVLVAEALSPTERVCAAYRTAEKAAKDLSDGKDGSGVSILIFAAATTLAYAVGREQAQETLRNAIAHIDDMPGAA